jgi:two-component system, NarL family, invasion response regulator UvrY
MRCKRVVIADQHPAMLEGMRRMLATETESVLMVSDEASLLQAVDAAAPDLVIVDLSLPVTGAGNVVRLLKQRFPAIPVVVVSDHDDPAAAGEVATAGAEGFVLKRRAVVDLVPAVREVCEGRRYCSA